jgi:hypothetical protein
MVRDILVQQESEASGQLRITPEQYQEFLRHYIVDALAGKRLGQSFCERHGISNASPLYYFRDNNFSERWIQDNYITHETQIS